MTLYVIEKLWSPNKDWIMEWDSEARWYWYSSLFSSTGYYAAKESLYICWKERRKFNPGRFRKPVVVQHLKSFLVACTICPRSLKVLGRYQIFLYHWGGSSCRPRPKERHKAGGNVKVDHERKRWWEGVSVTRLSTDIETNLIKYSVAKRIYNYVDQRTRGCEL